MKKKDSKVFVYIKRIEDVKKWTSQAIMIWILTTQAKRWKLLPFYWQHVKKNIYHNLNTELGNGKKIKIKKRHTSDKVSKRQNKIKEMHWL